LLVRLQIKNGGSSNQAGASGDLKTMKDRN
jgi:hypothetical protein